MHDTAFGSAYTSPGRNDMEHRWGKRIPCGSRVRLSAGAGMCGGGKLRNVSTSGAFIETSLELALFSHLLVAVIRIDPTREIETRASVVRIEPDGVAVEWCETPGGSICNEFGCTTRCAAAALHLGDCDATGS